MFYYTVTSYKSFYKLNAKKRIHFLEKFQYIYSLISDEINKIISTSSNFLLLSAGHSILIEKINANFFFVSEIIDEFHKLYKKKNVEELKTEDISKKTHSTQINDILVTSLEYSEDPLKLMDNLRQTIDSQGKVIILCNNIFWNPFLMLMEKIGAKFKHPRRNLITSNFIKNICNLTDFDLVKEKKIILMPIYIPLISSLFNNFIARIPFLNLFCFTSIFVLRPRLGTKLKITNLNISIIVPCKDEEKNISIVASSIKKIGKNTEVLFGNDASQDNTKDEIFKAIKSRKDIKIRYYDGPGTCKADNVYKGFNLATGDILIIHDADNTVNPSELNDLVKILINKNQNLVIGTRLIYPMENKAMKFSNYLGNIFFSFFYSFILEQKVTDTLCGTKILFKKDWEKIQGFCGKWGVKDKWGDFDILSGAKINMMRIAEVPVHYKERTEGETKMTNTIFNGIRMLIICIISFFRLRLIK